MRSLLSSLYVNMSNARMLPRLSLPMSVDRRVRPTAPWFLIAKSQAA